MNPYELEARVRGTRMNRVGGHQLTHVLTWAHRVPYYLDTDRVSPNNSEDTTRDLPKFSKTLPLLPFNGNRLWSLMESISLLPNLPQLRYVLRRIISYSLRRIMGFIFTHLPCLSDLHLIAGAKLINWNFWKSNLKIHRIQPLRSYFNKTDIMKT